MTNEDLWKKYQTTGNKEIKQQLVLSYLWLVKRLAGRLAVRLPVAINQEDLESCGVLGLLEAIDKFDPSMGRDFESYAYIRIRGAILDELRRINWIPRTVWQKLQAIRTARDRLENRLGRVVTEEDIARETGCAVTEVRRLDMHSRRIYTVSVDEMVVTTGGEAVRLGDVIPDGSSPDPLELILEEDNYDLLVRAIQSLSKKDQIVLSLYYKEGLTLKEIGQILSVSESRVCQLHRRALSRLRKKLGELFGK